MRLFRLAADKGLARARLDLGRMYARGEGVAQDEAEVVRWYRLAAERGQAPTQYTLGVMYANGEGVLQDEAEAVRLYRLAAKKGHARAQYDLGLSYANGAGVPKDPLLAHWASPDFPDTFGSPIMGSEVKHGVTTAVQSRVQD